MLIHGAVDDFNNEWICDDSYDDDYYADAMAPV